MKKLPWLDNVSCGSPMTLSCCTGTLNMGDHILNWKGKKVKQFEWRQVNRVIKLSLCVIIFFMWSCSCDDQRRNENAPTFSAALTYEQILQFYDEKSGISNSEASKALRSTILQGSDRNSEDYHIMTIPENYRNDKYDIYFVLSTRRKDDMELPKVVYAWIMDKNNSELTYLGDVKFWVRDGDEIEYVINGDFYETTNATAEVLEDEDEEGGNVIFASKTMNDLYSEKYIYLHGVVKLHQHK